MKKKRRLTLYKKERNKGIIKSRRYGKKNSIPICKEIEKYCIETCEGDEVVEYLKKGKYIQEMARQRTEGKYLGYS